MHRWDHGENRSPGSESVSAPRRPSLLRDARGAVQVEYIVLLTLVTLGAAVAVVGLGVPLLQHFRFARDLLLMPIP